MQYNQTLFCQHERRVPSPDRRQSLVRNGRVMITRRSRASIFALITAVAIHEVRASLRLDHTFPEDFTFGVATASYQIEGGWNTNGKGESIWDTFTHSDPTRIRDHQNADVADDSYNLYRRDVEMLHELGVDYYRFSISWSRVLPTGYTGRPNPDGVRYYNSLIDLLLQNHIQPVVTMFHWDLPQPLQNVGGWPNALMANYFVDYADFLFSTFGDRVKVWITFNEPKQTCLYGYGYGELAPGINATGFGEYLCGHTLLLAHARAYRLYIDKYREKQKGFIGFTIDCPWFEPATPADEQAAEETRQFYIGWYGHPIFSKSGDYPEVMRQAIANASAQEGLPGSRLPIFTLRQLELIRGSADFFGLNHYTTRLVSSARAKHPRPSFDDDLGYHIYQDPSWPSTNSSWLKVVPWGFGNVTRWIRAQYGAVAVLVTENGVSTVRGLRDAARVHYMREYLRSLLAAVRDGCPVFGYTHWSLMDNFEWDMGFSERFGLYEVDYDSAKRTRTPRDSAAFYREVIRTHRLDHSYASDGHHSLFHESAGHSGHVQQNVIENIDFRINIV